MTRYPGGYETYRSLRRNSGNGTTVVEPTHRCALEKRSPKAKRDPSRSRSPNERSSTEFWTRSPGSRPPSRSSRSQLADPALYAAAPSKPQRLRADHTQAERTLAERTARWEELESRRDVKRG